MTKEKAKRYDEALEIAKKNHITAQEMYKGSQIGISQSPLKTFPRVNEFEVGVSYRR